MGKDRSGYIFQENGKWYARITFTDNSGKRRNVKRLAENKTHAKEMLRQIQRNLDDNNEQVIFNQRMRFRELADYYAERYATPAQYVNDRKVAGLRSRRTVLLQLEVLKNYFSEKKIRELTTGDIQKFKSDRLATPTYRGQSRSIANVNRELALLRRMLNIAQAEGWIGKNPFNSLDRLINIGDEVKRERVITYEEEERLIEACCGIREHLKPIVICALETGLRKGEILSLRWSDVNLDEKMITVRAFNTKTMRRRFVAITGRLTTALKEVYEKSTKDPEQLCFGLGDVKKSFRSACRIASLDDLRFHDLRHTYATRLIAANVPLVEVGRVLGHTQPTTTYRYVNPDVEAARRAAMALEELSQKQKERQ